MIREANLRSNRFINTDEIQYVILPGKSVSERYIELYHKLFSFWKKSWQPIYKMLDSHYNMSSDLFTRQSEVTGFFYKSEVIAFFGMDTFNVSCPAHHEHSYFKAYPQEVIEFLRINRIHKVIVDNQLAVKKEYRGGPLAELLIGLTLKRLQESQFDYILSYTRNSKKTNEMGYKWGWYPILKDHHAHGESADYVLIEKGNLEKYYQHPLCGQVEKLWKNRIHENGFITERNYNESINFKNSISANAVSSEYDL